MRTQVLTLEALATDDTTMKYKLYQEVMLLVDVSESKLVRGDLVTIIEHHPRQNGEDGYSLEVFNALGDSIAVVTVPESNLAPLQKDEVLSVRSLRIA